MVIGHDHRMGSLEFARVTAATFASRGIKVKLFGQIVPTPYVSFAVKYYKADFGVMITASHNPKGDNGYKVYGPDSCQIRSPTDKHVSEHILTENRVLWEIEADGIYEDPIEEIHDAYMASTLEFWVGRSIGKAPNVVYTPMHGVGYKFVKDLLAQAYLPSLIPVKAQMEPDSQFPTVKFPNPEEGAGALQLAMETADSTGSRIVFANDPDADRFNFAEKQGDQSWRIFNGNEVALLLADFLFNSKPERKVAMVSSLVSSRSLGWMAEAEGFRFEQAETGFKNLSAKARELESEGYTVLLTYEEAIGYMVGTNVWDKDGLSALLAAYHMVIEMYGKGSTLTDRLDELQDKYGYQVQYNSYYYAQSQQQLKSAFYHLLSKISEIDSQLGDYALVDLKNYCPATKMVIFTFEELGGAWIAIRPSGTEPKIKFYSECKAGSREQVSEFREKLEIIVKSVCELLLNPSEHHLILKSE